MQLKPIRISPEIDKETERQILEFIKQEVFLPIIKAMDSQEFFNSSNPIEEAIRSGKIRYVGGFEGYFQGDFNAKITKEFKALGLKYDAKIKGYRKDVLKLPINLQIVISQKALAQKKIAKDVISAIDRLNPDYEKVSFVSNYDAALVKIDKDFTKTVSDVIGIKVDITDFQRFKIAEDYSNNLKLYIKDFIEEQIPFLRQDVEKAVFEGVRAKSLQKTIIERFGVSESKAKFLAKQEISLLTSKYKEAKYQQAGVNKYKWSISNVRTRPDHKALNGKIFSFDDPPVSNRDTGARNNPGEDFGCNCVAIPFFD